MTSGQPYYDDEPPQPRYRSLKVPDRPGYAEPPAEEFSKGRRQRRRRSVLSRIGSLFILLFLVGVAGLGALFYGDAQFQSTGPLKQAKSVVIERGSGTAKIANTLERAGVVSHAAIFQAGVVARQAQSKLKAGEYSFEPGISMKGVMDKLVSGKVTNYKITVPEGLTSQQIVARVMAHPDLTGDIAEVPPEGSLLPQTYSFQRGEKRSGVIERMRNAQKKLVEKLWDGRAEGLPVKTPGEALILASIVEKETGVASERARVAAVFVNRLHKGMRLQSDPTIIYGIVGGKGKLGRPIRRSEIDKKTPYNTYKIDGLPPTPIANPGEASIAAVLNPLSTSDLYFVADGTGGHAFSKTLAEHNQKVRNWRKIEREKRAEEKAALAAAEATQPVAEPTAEAQPLDPVPEANPSLRPSAEETDTEAAAVEPPVPGVPAPEPLDVTPEPAGVGEPPSDDEPTTTASLRGTASSPSGVPIPRPKPKLRATQ